MRVEIGGRVHSLVICAIVNDYLLGGRVAYIDRGAAAKMIDVGPAEFFVVDARPNVASAELAARLEGLFAGEGIVVQSFAQQRRQLDSLIGGVVGALGVGRGQGVEQHRPGDLRRLTRLPRQPHGVGAVAPARLGVSGQPPRLLRRVLRPLRVNLPDPGVDALGLLLPP